MATPLALQAALLAVMVGCCQASQIFGLQWKCVGWFCPKSQIDLVHVEPYYGTWITLATVVQPGDKADIEGLQAVTAYSPSNRTYFAVLTDNTKSVNTLFAYSNVTGSLTNAAIPFLYNGWNLTSIEYDTVGERLIGNYGPQIVSIDPTSGSVSLLTKFFDGTVDLSGTVTMFDQFNGNYVSTVFPIHDVNGCYWLYAVNLASGNITKSPCLPNPSDNPGNFALVNSVAYNATTYLALWDDILGGELNYFTLTTAYEGRIFGPSDFAAWDWMLYGYDTVTYDPSLNVVWLLVNDGDGNMLMGGVDIAKKTGIAGAQFKTQTELRGLQLMY